MSLFELGIGISAAVRSPRWIGGSHLDQLVRDQERPLLVSRDPALAMKASAVALRLLARLPFTPWRNTCLYRSVAECIALRHCGVAARLRLGVAHGSESEGAITAHAWVERPIGDGTDQDYVPLHFDR
jgi:hypothetical protein